MADAHKRRANVDIDHDVHEDLKKVKTDNGLKKIGDAVRVLAATTLIELMRQRVRRTRVKTLASR
jgi:hypothetical protein